MPIGACFTTLAIHQGNAPQERESMTQMFPEVFTPMLATLVAKPFDSPEHLFEIKWDGVRTLAYCDLDSTRLFARSRREVTHQYVEFANMHTRCKDAKVILDGEIVALAEDARPSFGRLQHRIGLSKPRDVMRGVQEITLDFIVFDIVFIGDEWIGGMPLEARRDRLAKSFDFGERVSMSQAIPGQGVALFSAAKAKGLEGIVAKMSDSYYVPGRRSKDWSKIKATHSADCVIGGFTRGGGRRSGTLGALLVGVYDETGLRYVGSVGTGFDDRTLASLTERLLSVTRDTSPFVDQIPPKGVSWVEPTLVCEVEYREFTDYQKMRAPSFKGLREDKEPQLCLLGAQFV
ncbi:MAG: non-homologous end-joining DNA ligase [Actinobacteria bacterium]|nr:non-homologous end-joining DNA ligase [Actinomycetota bacterium]